MSLARGGLALELRVFGGVRCGPNCLPRLSLGIGDSPVFRACSGHVGSRWRLRCQQYICNGLIDHVGGSERTWLFVWFMKIVKSGFSIVEKNDFLSTARKRFL